ncbi:hypothetical protein SZN_24578 [Streptomyces zinciresistens K42]|uniref:DUF397 domain-containing protein n=1 Tax=Streptomyces zinciresistens K42 TaxID=700597 RepID=G2GHD1_9ACTN|nr:DUF397 domain-containing protein [Streptomyces zinciresistens]EGX57085.1 hypothetical protein SZN_24578 [Streptomyces zinciresistens K42]
MNTEQHTQLDWFKSSYSGDEGGECVEMATTPTAVRVRDSKKRGGPQLAFAQGTWAGFVSGLAWSRSN